MVLATNLVLIVLLNCTINPFIHLVKYQDYQKALKSCVGCGKQAGKEESDISGNVTSSSMANNS